MTRRGLHQVLAGVVSVVGVLAWSAGPASAQLGGRMEDLGTLGGPLSWAYGVSADGSVVVGEATTAGDRRAFRWTAAGGMKNLGTLDGSWSRAYGVSADGSVVVGRAGNAANYARAFRWTAAGGMKNLGTLGGLWSEAYGVSADGSVVVGVAANAAGDWRAFRWTAAGGMKNLGTLDGSLSWAIGVSADGSVVVGCAYNAAGYGRAFRWTAAGGMKNLGTLGGLWSEAYGVSADGSVVVGVADNAAGYGRAFRWTAAGGMKNLGTLDGSASWAIGVSADGSVVVGGAENAAGDWRAFRWTATGGMKDLGTLGGSDSLAWGVSADGSVVVGYAQNAAGYERAFRWVSGGYVLFADRTPIRGAVVYAYWLTGTRAAPVISSLGTYEVTDENGWFAQPAAFLDYPNLRLGLLAVVAYRDPGTGEIYFIVNYPNYDPLQPFSGRLTGTENIIFPYPTILQAGWQDGTGGFQYFADYLRDDPGANPSKYAACLPGFITFTMPSQQQNNKSWGYDNATPSLRLLRLKEGFYDDNVKRLDNFITKPNSTESIRGVLAQLVPTGLNNLPIHLCAHSMGGTISRGWMSAVQNRKLSGPPVSRYVSFDGVHGASTFFWGSIGSFSPIFAEWNMNGYNLSTGQAPAGGAQWNYRNMVEKNKNYLLLSSSSCDVVRPNCSALGVGRTMKGRFWPLSWMDNGHRGRFIGGYELHLFGKNTDHTHIRTDLDTIIKVVRFLAHGIYPAGSQESGSAYDCVDNPAPLEADDSEPGVSMVTITADANQVVESSIYVDANFSIGISALIEGSDAGLDILDPEGCSIIPSDPEVVEFEDVRSITFALSAPPRAYTGFACSPMLRPRRLSSSSPSTTRGSCSSICPMYLSRQVRQLRSQAPYTQKTETSSLDSGAASWLRSLGLTRCNKWFRCSTTATTMTEKRAMVSMRISLMPPNWADVISFMRTDRS